MNAFTISSSSEKVELSLEEESMALTAAIFVVRYIPQVFNTTTTIRYSDIVTAINNLPLGDLDNFNIDMTTLHYAIDFYSSFGQHVPGMTFSKTKKADSNVVEMQAQHGKQSLKTKVYGWEICCTDHN